MYAAIQGVHDLASSGALGAALLFVASAVPILSGCAGIVTRPWRRTELIVSALSGSTIAVLANFGVISSLLLGGSAAREAGGLILVTLVVLIAVVVPFSAVRLAVERRGWLVYGSLAVLFLDLLVNATLLGWSISRLSVQTVITSIDVVASVALPVALVHRRGLQLDRLAISLAVSTPVAVYLMIGLSLAVGFRGRI